MMDYICRQAAIDAIFGITAYKNRVPVFSAVFNIQKIPAAPVREVKRGKWLDGYCSCCGERTVWDETDYCPNCGADMRD